VMALVAPASSTVQVFKFVAGSPTFFGTFPTPTVAPDVWYSMRLAVDASGRWAFWCWPAEAQAGQPIAVGSDTALATGGALASGKPTFFDLNTAATANTRQYKNFKVWVPTFDAVLHANQSAELRWDGMFREDSGGTAYGPVSHVVGDLPRIPPSGLEGRTVEVFLKWTRGDFDQLPDSGIDAGSAQVTYNPSYLFVPSAG
jgi:hypothetical protein